MKKNEPYTRNNTKATFDNSELLIAIVERLAGKHIEYTYPEIIVPAGLKSVETSSVEAYVRGRIFISEKRGYINMPFDSCFLFTCTRSSNSKYSMTWALSLS